jgi:hypothetical protein
LRLPFVQSINPRISFVISNELCDLTPLNESRF